MSSWIIRMTKENENKYIRMSLMSGDNFYWSVQLRMRKCTGVSKNGGKSLQATLMLGKKQLIKVKRPKQCFLSPLLIIWVYSPE